MVTQKDIADFLKTPQSTISVALNDNYDSIKISEERRAYIKKTAKEMGYVVDDMARAIKTGKSKIISYIIQGIAEDAFEGLVETARKYDYVVEPFFIRKDKPSSLSQIIAHIAKRRIAAVCISYGAPSARLLAKKLQELKIPCAVGVKVENPPAGIYTMDSDQKNGMRLIAEHLGSRGHSRICYIGMDSYVSFYRKTLLEESLRKKGVSRSFKSIIGSYKHQKNMIREMMLDKQARPTAICTSGTGSLINTVAELYALGCRIPDDVSVISYGDSVYLPLMACQITAIREKSREQAMLVCEKLIEMIGSGVQIDSDELCDVKLIIRDSVAKI